MGRRKRGWIDGACYHITHRCHNREFLFRYKKYRQFYLRHLFEMQKRYRIDVLDYIVTSNHVHLLLTAANIEQFRKWHTLTVDNILQKKELERMKFWSNAYAVGDDDWIKIQLQQAGIKRMSIKNSKGISFARGENV